MSGETAQAFASARLNQAAEETSQPPLWPHEYFAKVKAGTGHILGPIHLHARLEPRPGQGAPTLPRKQHTRRCLLLHRLIRCRG